jgi:hypothetical protein
MSHSSKLINRFLHEIKKTYPERSGVQYIIEQRLKGSEINIQPDIQVIDRDDNIVCVVEIGYTRPEKLALYKKVQIPDIRWYSKDGEFLNPHEHIHTTIAQIKYYDVFPEEDTWREVDLNEMNHLICDNCFETRYIEVKAEINQTPIEQDVDINYKDDDPIIFDSASDKWLKEADVYGELWCNGTRWFCVWFCDECGFTEFMTGEKLMHTIYWHEFASEGKGSFSYDEFLNNHYKELDKGFKKANTTEQMIRQSLYFDLGKKANFKDLQKYIFYEYGYKIEYGNIAKVPN